MKIVRNILVSTALVLAGGVANSADGDSSQLADEPMRSDTCVNTRFVNNFSALSDQHLFVEARRKEFYLLTLKQRCFDLRSARSIAFNDTTSKVCSGGFGKVIYRSPFAGLESCRIGSVEIVEDKDAAKELIAERKAS